MQINSTGWLSGPAFMSVEIGATQVQPYVNFTVSSISVNDNGAYSPLNITLIVPDFPYFPANRPLHLHLETLAPGFFRIFVNPLVIVNFQTQTDLNGDFDPNILVFEGTVGITESLFELQAPYDLLQLAISPMYISGLNDGETLNTGQTTIFPPAIVLFEAGACLVPTDSEDPNMPNECSANPTSGHMKLLPVQVNETPISPSTFIDDITNVIGFSFILIIGLCALVLLCAVISMGYQSGILLSGMIINSDIWCKGWCIRNCGCYCCKQYRKPEKLKADPLITAVRAHPGVIIVNDRVYDRTTYEQMGSRRNPNYAPRRHRYYEDDDDDL
jgi:hypothetical protein